MLNKEKFNRTIQLLGENFNFKIDNSDYLKLLYNKLKHISDSEFEQITSKLFLITQQDWHSKYGFGGKPALADWLTFFGVIIPLSNEQEALIEVNKLITYARACFDTHVISDNPFLNQTLKDYGGITKLCWDLDSSNEKKKDETWLRKELVESYLSNKAANKKCMEKSVKKEARYDFKGRRVNPERLGIIGDKEKIAALLENNFSEEIETQIKLNLLLQNITKQK